MERTKIKWGSFLIWPSLKLREEETKIIFLFMRAHKHGMGYWVKKDYHSPSHQTQILDWLKCLEDMKASSHVTRSLMPWSIQETREPKNPSMVTPPWEATFTPFMSPTWILLLTPKNNLISCIIFYILATINWKLN